MTIEHCGTVFRHDFSLCDVRAHTTRGWEESGRHRLPEPSFPSLHKYCTSHLPVTPQGLGMGVSHMALTLGTRVQQKEQIWTMTG